MDIDQSKDHGELKRLLEENIAVAKENNTYIKKLYRGTIIATVLQLLWYALLIGLPFALYHYLLDPYFKALGSNADLFRAGLEEVPGIKGFEKILP